MAAAESSIESLLSTEEKDAKIHEASHQLMRLREAMAKFNKSRARTREVMEGRRKARVTAQEAASIVMRHRDDAKEREAVSGFRDLMRLIMEREPEVAEMVAGIPPVNEEQLGVLPLIPLAAIAGGAFTLTTMFNWLNSRETTAQREMGMSHTWSEVLGQTAPFWGPLFAVGGLSFGGYALYREVKGDSLFAGVKGWFGSGGSKKRRRPARKPGPKRLAAKPEPEPEPEDTDESEE